VKQIILFLSFVLALFFVSCEKKPVVSESNEEQKTDSATMAVAVMPTIDCLPLYVADERGFFSKEGISIKLVEFKSQMDCDTALLRGHVGALMTDLVRAGYMEDKDSVKLKFISSTNASWKLVCDTAKLTSLKGLDDKLIAMTRFSATSLLSDTIVAMAKLNPEKVFRVQINDVSVRLGMFFTHTMDAMLLPEPQAMAAVNEGAMVLYNSEDADIWLGVFAVDEKRAKSFDVEAFKRAYDEACDSLNTYGVKGYSDILKRRFMVTEAVIDSLPSVTFRHTALPREKDMSIASGWLNNAK
jgi:NitT/TauT family transport system substrate-binding protein